jgi:hypothetical protein
MDVIYEDMQKIFLKRQHRRYLTNFVTFAIYNLTAFLVGTLRHQTLSQGPQAYCRSSAGTIPWCAKSLHALRFLTSRNCNEN